jgi:outer membrane protein OmpA-like peptidoglycan-associated protein
MATNLLDMLKGALGSDVVSQAAKYLGESEGATQSAVGALLPALLGGMAKKAASPAGAADLLRSLTSADVDTSLLGNLAGVFAGGDRTNSLMKLGGSVLSGLFGDKTGALTNAISSITGMKSSSVASLLSLVAPAVFALAKRYVSQNNLDAGGLAKLLLGQKDALASALDSRVTSALGWGSPASFASALAPSSAAAPMSAEASGRSGMRRILPWIVAAIVALALLSMLRNCGKPVEKPVAPVPSAAVKEILLPDGTKISVRESGFLDQLVVYLNRGDAAAGTAFVADAINFETGSATLTADSADQIGHVAAVLAAFPNVAISVEGHTDNTGDAAANKTLSEQRATAVRQALVDKGVGADRVAAAGFGPEKPVASNDTEEGKAQNRRVEIIVTKR